MDTTTIIMIMYTFVHALLKNIVGDQRLHIQLHLAYTSVPTPYNTCLAYTANCIRSFYITCRVTFYLLTLEIIHFKNI